MAPYPVQPGKNVVVTAHGFQDETVTGGTWDTKIYLWGVEVQHDSGHVCGLIPNCPCPCKLNLKNLNKPSFITFIFFFRQTWKLFYCSNYCR